MSRSLPRTAAAEARIDPAAISRLLDAFNSAPDIEPHGLMILRHGCVVAEGWWRPYSADRIHLLYSLTKSFASTAIGFAVAEGLLGLDDLVLEHFKEQAPRNISEHLAKLRVRHLLSMSVGHETEPVLDARNVEWQEAARRFLSHPVVFEPGTRFLYNTPASQMLSILIQKRSGVKLDAFLGTRLLEPLGVADVRWTSGTDWVWGGSGLHATTESIAKLGQLYLDLGRWEARQLLPSGWAELATARHIDNGTDPASDWCQGYGFQFWRSRHGYRGDGAFGQFCLVLPEWDMVVAMTSGQSNLQGILDAVWEILLPGVDGQTGSPHLLEAQLAELDLAGVSAGGPSRLRLSNPERAFNFEILDEKVTLQMGFRLELRLGVWEEVVFDFGLAEGFPAAAHARWVQANSFEIKIVNLETPQSRTVGFRLVGDGAEVSFTESGVFEPLEPIQFTASRLSAQ